MKNNCVLAAVSKSVDGESFRLCNRAPSRVNADDFRDYMLSFLFLKYLSDNYVKAVHDELGSDYPTPPEETDEGKLKATPLQIWYNQNEEDAVEFESVMRRRMHYVIKPAFLWDSIAELARTQDGDLLDTLQQSFKHIEEESFESVFQGLFSEINLRSEKLGKDYSARNDKLCTIVGKIAGAMPDFSRDQDTIGDAYEYLIGEFAAGSGKKAGEFYTPQSVSDILSGIVSLDSQNPASGKKSYLASVLDMRLIEPPSFDKALRYECNER